MSGLSSRPLRLQSWIPPSFAWTTAPDVLCIDVPLGDPDLVEFDWGSWTGRPLDDDLEREVAQIRGRWHAGDVDLAAPAGESPVDAGRRAGRFLARLAASGFSAPVVVAHGRFNRVLMALLLGRALSRMDEVRQRNGSVSLFDWDGSSPARALLLDDVSHLDEQLARPVGRSDSLQWK